MLTIDGAMGEGGGQVLRTSLALAAITGTPITIERIRAKRSRPGLLRQHLTAVRAMGEVCSARVVGAELGSPQIRFEPGKTRHGNYHFAVGTAGSATLVLQTILPALLVSEGESTVILEGGTHNAWAPPFDFIRDTFVPLLQRMGAHVSVELERYGFYPAGGGRILLHVAGGKTLGPLTINERGPIQKVKIRAVVSEIPEHVAEREVRTLALLLADFPIEVESALVESNGPGNVASVAIHCEHLTETFTGFGERGVRAETVAHTLAGEVRKYLSAEAPVGEHLADQLLLPLALCGSGTFRTAKPSLHATTNLQVIEKFLPGRLHFDERTGRIEAHPVTGPADLAP
jgi:RNA 3'-terminal phosphate cyclase (ATP)